MNRSLRSTVYVHSLRSKGCHDIDVTDHDDDETLTSFGRPSLSQLNFFSLERVHGRVHLRKGDADHRAEMKNDDSYSHLRSYRRKTTPDAH